jgi:beta-N-acetylhexosaminidase
VSSQSGARCFAILVASLLLGLLAGPPSESPIAFAVPARQAAAPCPPAPPPPAAPPVALTVEQQVGQMLMAGVTSPVVADDLHHLVADLHVGNVVLMGPSVESPAQLLALTRELQTLALAANGVGLLVATDQEGGRVQRLRSGFTALPDAATVGAIELPARVRAYGRVIGDELAAVGVNLDLAPVLDVNDNPANPVIGNRAFGTTPEQVEGAALLYLAGLHDAGVAGTGKHFPGHGNTSTDSHLAQPYVEKDRAELDAVELRPFRAAIAAGIDAIMLAHVAYPALDPSDRPATISAPIATCLLRGELGFDGLILTDDMGMEGITALYAPEEAAVQAVLAGADIVLCARLELAGACSPPMLERLRAGLLQAVADGRLSEARVAASVTRVLALKTRYAVGPATGSQLSTVGGAAHARQVAELTSPQ